MRRKRELAKKAHELRQRAEAIAKKEPAPPHRREEKSSPDEMQQQMHELHVVQIELELQNEELRRTQIALDAARARYFDLYHFAPVGYLTVNQKGLILDSNLMAATLLGMDGGALLGMRFGQFILAEDEEIYYSHRKELFKSGVTQSWELRLRRNDGVPFWGHLVASVAKNNEFRVCRVVISDITERKRVDETKAKLEAQLHQAQRMESIGRLAGGVAHDLNNMLGLILGHLDLALGKSDPTYDIDLGLQEIRDAAQRSAAITKQLLVFARKQAVVPKVLDLNKIVTVMLPMLQRLIGANIQFDWHPAATLWSVNVDPSQIDQVLVNLCVNARDAMKDIGKISIATENVTIAETDDIIGEKRGGEYVRLTVSDDGRGMDKETLTHVFEPFFTTKAVGKGTGLGLAMVHGVVEQNNGFIDVRSEPDVGTTMEVHLPRHDGAVADVCVGRDAEWPKGGTETILVVEDEPALLRVCNRLLVQLGYTVLLANVPSEAIRLTNEYAHKLDLILTDVVMPEMNGSELLKRLRTQLPETKQLFMSGYAADVIADLEGKHFIQKPFTLTQLAAKVREVLDGG